MHKSSLTNWLYKFLFCNAILLWLVGIHYLFYIEPFTSGLLTTSGKIQTIFFIMVSYLGYLGLIAFIPAIIILPLIYISPKRSIIFPLSVFFSTIITFFIIFDSFIFRIFRFHINLLLLFMIFNHDMGDAFDLSWLEYFYIFSILFSVIAIEIFLAVFTYKNLQQKILKKSANIMTFVIPICLYLSYMFLIFSSEQMIFAIFVENTRFLPYYDNILAIVMPGENNNIALQTIHEARITQPSSFERPLQYPLTPLQCQKPKNLPNIIFIVVDSLRFDMVNKTVMPHTYQFAQTAWQFQNHMSGGNATRPGIFSLFYALPTTYWTSMKDQKVAPIFLDQLQKYNYQMGIFISASLRILEFDKTILLHMKNIPEPTIGDNPYEKDVKITEEFSDFINHRAKQPFFSLIYYDAPHGSCKVPNAIAPFKPAVATCNRLELTKDKDPTDYLNRYKNAVWLDDQLIQKDLAVLKQHNLLRNTIIVITSDHGQEFNDHKSGYWGHSSNFSRYQLQTPLIIYIPGQKPKNFIHETTHYDITPTLLTKVLGCSTPSNSYSIGQSLTENRTIPYLIVGSYIGFGIVTANEIINIYPNGNFQITDLHNTPIDNVKLNPVLMKQVFQDLTRFYKK